MQPGHIICRGVSRKPLHRGRIILDERDSVARCSLKRVQRSLLTPLLKYFLGVIKSAQDHQCLAGIGVMLSRGHGGMFNCPIKLLQSVFRSAQLRVSNSQQVEGGRTTRIRFLVQNKYGSFLSRLPRYG